MLVGRLIKFLELGDWADLFRRAIPV
jgi:hypothetical protein